MSPLTGPNPLFALVGGVTVRNRTQQCLITVCVCATRRWVDAGAQHQGQRKHGPAAAPACEGGAADAPAVFQRVGVWKEPRFQSLSGRIIWCLDASLQAGGNPGGCGGHGHWHTSFLALPRRTYYPYAPRGWHPYGTAPQVSHRLSL